MKIRRTVPVVLCASAVLVGMNYPFPAGLAHSDITDQTISPSPVFDTDSWNNVKVYAYSRKHCKGKKRAVSSGTYGVSGYRSVLLHRSDWGTIYFEDGSTKLLENRRCRQLKNQHALITAHAG